MSFNPFDRLSVFKVGVETGQIPRTLFKYTSIDNLKLILENSTLKFSTISEFNDKRECFAQMDFSCTHQEWAAYLKGINTGMPKSYVNALIKRVIKKPDLGIRVIKKAIKATNNHLGILCLTTRNDNNLMWAHYAESHGGVCLEFDVSKDLDTFCFPKAVDYDDSIRRYNYVRSWINRKGMDVTESIFHKTSDWSYEQEYRVVRIDGAGIVSFNIEALRSICFGIDTPKKTIDEIVKLCTQKGYTHLSFKQMTIDEQTGAFCPVVIKG